MRSRTAFIVVLLFASVVLAGVPARRAPATKPYDANLDANHPLVFNPIFNLIPKDLSDQITPMSKAWSSGKSNPEKEKKLAEDIKKAIVGKTVVVPCVVDIKRENNGLYFVSVDAVGTTIRISFSLRGTLRITEQEIPAWVAIVRSKPILTATFTDKVLVGFEVVKDKRTGMQFLAFGISQRGNDWQALNFSVSGSKNP